MQSGCIQATMQSKQPHNAYMRPLRLHIQLCLFWVLTQTQLVTVCFFKTQKNCHSSDQSLLSLFSLSKIQTHSSRLRLSRNSIGHRLAPLSSSSDLRARQPIFENYRPPLKIICFPSTIGHCLPLTISEFICLFFSNNGAPRDPSTFL